MCRVIEIGEWKLVGESQIAEYQLGITGCQLNRQPRIAFRAGCVKQRSTSHTNTDAILYIHTQRNQHFPKSRRDSKWKPAAWRSDLETEQREKHNISPGKKGGTVICLYLCLLWKFVKPASVASHQKQLIESRQKIYRSVRCRVLSFNGLSHQKISLPVPIKGDNWRKYSWYSDNYFVPNLTLQWITMSSLRFQ